MRYLVAAKIIGTNKRIYLPEIHYNESSAKALIRKLTNKSVYTDFCLMEYPEKSFDKNSLESEIQKIDETFCRIDILQEAIELVEQNDIPFEKKAILDIMAEYLNNNGYFVASVETQKELTNLQELIN